MAINPLLRSNPVRMMGMASGMDTESIIQATLRMHQFKIDRQMKNKQLIEWKQQYHNDIKNQITNIKNTYLSNLGSKNMMSRNAYNASIATLSTLSGKTPTAVSVSTSSASSLGTLTIKQVHSLAKGSNVSTTGHASQDGVGFNPSSTKLEDLVFADGTKLSFTDYKASVVNNSGAAASVSQSDVEALVANSAAWSDEYATLTGPGGTKIEISRTDDGKYTWAAYNSAGVWFDGNVDENGDKVGDREPLEFEGGEINIGNVAGLGKVKLFDEGSGKVGISVTDSVYDDKTVFEGPLSFMREAQLGDVTLVKDENDNVANDGKILKFAGSASLTINGKPIELKSDWTINQMVDAVNNSDAGVTMTYDRMQDKFTIESKTIGAGGALVFDGRATNEGGTGGDGSEVDILNKLFGVTSGNPTVIAGTQAKLELEDGTIITGNSNSLEVRGISIKLNHTTGVLSEEDRIKVEVKRDTDKAYDAIKDFIDTYNTLIAKLESLMNDRKATNERGYEPLTDEEKASMTEKQIEEWEAIAKKGILRSDHGIQSLVTNLRATFFEKIEGTGLSPSQLGLTTGPYNGGTGGQIIIDETKLRAALEEDPDRVADVFIKIEYDENGVGTGVGLMHKLNDLMTKYVNNTQLNSLDSLERSLKEENERIDKLTERMYAEEDKLYRQFAAMETALSQMQSQGDWFSAMLGAK